MTDCVLWASGGYALPDAYGGVLVILLSCWVTRAVVKVFDSKKRAVLASLGVAFGMTVMRNASGADAEPFIIPYEYFSSFFFPFRLCVYGLLSLMASWLVLRRLRRMDLIDSDLIDSSEATEKNTEKSITEKR